MSFSGDICIVVPLQATLAGFHHTIKVRNNIEKKEKAESNLDLHRYEVQMIRLLQPCTQLLPDTSSRSALATFIPPTKQATLISPFHSEQVLCSPGCSTAIESLQIFLTKILQHTQQKYCCPCGYKCLWFVISIFYVPKNTFNPWDILMSGLHMNPTQQYLIRQEGPVISKLRALYTKNSKQQFQPTSLEVCPAHQFRNDENLKLFQFIQITCNRHKLSNGKALPPFTAELLPTNFNLLTAAVLLLLTADFVC